MSLRRKLPCVALVPSPQALGDERTHEHVGIEGIANRQAPALLDEPRHEGIVDPLGDQDPCRRVVPLPGSEKGPHHDLVDRTVELGIIEDDGRPLAARLDHHRELRALRRHALDGRGGRVAPCHGENRDLGMQHKALPHDGAGTLHHVVDAAWQATAVPQLCDQLPDPRRELAGLRDNSVASQDRRGTLHRGNQQGEVGGTQQTDDAPWHPIAPRANLLDERGRQHLHTLIEEQIEGPNAGEDFLPTLPEGLARLAAHHSGEALLAPGDLVPEPAHGRCTVGEGEPSPGPRAHIRKLDRFGDVGLGEAEPTQHISTVTWVHAVDVAIDHLRLHEGAVDVVALPNDSIA